MSLKDRLFHAWDTYNTLDEKVYIAVLITGVVTSCCALLMAVIQRLSIYALLGGGACLIWFSALLVLCRRRRGVTHKQRLLLVCVLNFVLFPFCFFAFGGLNGGLELFFLLGLFNIGLLLRGRTRVVVFALSLVSMLCMLFLAQSYYLSSLTLFQKYLDLKLSLMLTAFALVAMTALVVKAYETERARNLELMGRLRGLSTRDALSGLYNRRELSRRLDLVYKSPQERTRRDEHLTRKNCYIAMFDVDDFKRLNDTYGHQFGDTVLSTVSQTLNGAVDVKAGELAARYGGEEFVCILYAPAHEEAFRRTDAVRQKIAALSWEVPGLTVTISGGLVSCEEYDQLKQAMLAVDKLLYQAKHSGKNQIADRFDEADTEIRTVF